MNFSGDARREARQVLGSILVRRVGKLLLTGMILETEAYLGEHDPASHVARGRTPRTEVLYGPPGYAYVYQMHRQHLLNVSCGPAGDPGCVLIRSVVPIDGIDSMRENRGKPEGYDERELTNGPGKLCKAFGITMELYGVNLTDVSSPLFIVRDISMIPGYQGEGIPPSLRSAYEVNATERIGISKAVDEKLRFVAEWE